MSNTYASPEVLVYDEWRDCKFESFVPSSRQLAVISAVQAALDAGMFYTEEVRNFCIDRMGVTPEQAKKGNDRVEGGDFGMDCYYARDYLRHSKERMDILGARAALKPFVGQSLGVLIFNDFKRNTSAVLSALHDDGRMMTLNVKRGRSSVEIYCTPMQLKNAVNRAFEKGSRKDSFEQAFPVPVSPVTVESDESSEIEINLERPRG